MLPTDQPRLFEAVTAILAAYGKQPTKSDLESWWAECKGLTFDAFEAAIKSHKADPDRGERAPRPVDVSRRMKAGNQNAARCSATDHSGRCEYPGIFSDGTAGEGPWYCPWHRIDRAGPEASRWIEISRQVPYAEARDKRIERMNAEAVRAPAVVDLSHSIALRHGNKPWETRMKWPGGLSPDEETLVPRESGQDESEAAA